MLSTMLLHVIEASRPVDSSRDFARCNRRVQYMGHALFFIDHLNNVGPAESSGIEWLAAGGGVERGSVQVNTPPVVRGVDDLRAKLPQVAVLIVEAFGHEVYKSYGAGEVISTSARMNCQSGNS